MDARELPFAFNVVDGLLVPLMITQGKVDQVKQKLSLCPGDVIVNTYPKSGTTWVQQILMLLRSGEKDGARDFTSVVPWLETGDVQMIESLTRPFYLKSHMPYELTLGGLPHTTPAKYIYIVRNPKDVAVSYYHHMRGFKIDAFSGSWEEFFDLFLAGRISFGSWFDHVLGWWKYKDAENVLFLKYEDMKLNLREAVQKIAAFVLPDPPPASVLDKVAEQSTFGSMKESLATNHLFTSSQFRNLDQAPFMRKGKVGDWRNYFTAEQNAAFDALYAERMKDSGLSIDFD